MLKSVLCNTYLMENIVIDSNELPDWYKKSLKAAERGLYWFQDYISDWSETSRYMTGDIVYASDDIVYVATPVFHIYMSFFKTETTEIPNINQDPVDGIGWRVRKRICND